MKENAVEIILLRILTLGLKKKLMLRLVGKGHNFCLYRGAIARTDTLYLTIEKRRVRQPSAEHLMGGFRGIDSKTLTLFENAMHTRQVGEFMEISAVNKRVVTILRNSKREVDRTSVDTHRRTGFHSVGSKSEFAQRLGKTARCRLGYTSALYLSAADMHQTVKKCAVCEHHAFCIKPDTHSRHNTFDNTILYDDIYNIILPHRQVRCILKYMTPYR